MIHFHEMCCNWNFLIPWWTLPVSCAGLHLSLRLCARSEKKEHKNSSTCYAAACWCEYLHHSSSVSQSCRPHPPEDLCERLVYWGSVGPSSKSLPWGAPRRVIHTWTSWSATDWLLSREKKSSHQNVSVKIIESWWIFRWGDVSNIIMCLCDFFIQICRLETLK